MSNRVYYVVTEDVTEVPDLWEWRIYYLPHAINEFEDYMIHEIAETVWRKSEYTWHAHEDRYIHVYEGEPSDGGNVIGIYEVTFDYSPRFSFTEVDT